MNRLLENKNRFLESFRASRKKGFQLPVISTANKFPNSEIQANAYSKCKFLQKAINVSINEFDEKRFFEVFKEKLIPQGIFKRHIS